MAPAPTTVAPTRVSRVTSYGSPDATVVRGTRPVPVGSVPPHAQPSHASSSQAPLLVPAPARSQWSAPEPAPQQRVVPQPAPRPVPAPTPVPSAGAGAGAASGPAAGAAVAARSVDAPVVVLAAVVAALVVAAVVVAVVVLGGGSRGASPDALASAPAPSAATTQRAPGAVPAPAGTRTFASPTHNITCEVSATQARCGIAQLADKPADVDGCAGTVGYVVVVDADGVTAPCVPTGQQPAAAGQGVDVLKYGAKITVGSLRCDSTKEGVRCTDTRTSKGFTLARAGISTF